jgi:hypothetical protein
MPALFLRVLAATAALMAVQGVAASIAFAVFGPAPDLPPGSLGWVTLSNLLTAVVLAWLATRSWLAGIRLAAWLAVLLFGVATFNSMVEALFFHVFGRTDFARYVLLGALVAALFSPLLVVVLGRWREAGAPRGRASLPAGASSWTWRLAAADLLYVACYFGAGILIYPFVRDFYEARSLPPRLPIAAFQLLLRGPVFIALILLAVRGLEGVRGGRSVLAGTLLGIVGGVAPLLIPNPYFPDVVRWAHLFEVGISNFIDGAAVAWLLTPPDRPATAAPGSPPAARTSGR